MAKYIDAERYINNLRELRTGDKDTVYEYYDDGIDVAISEAATFPAADIPRWIPVTERLPEEKDAGILKALRIEKRSEYVLATVEVKGEKMTTTACTLDGKWDWDLKYAFPDFKVVAWMPMPEPYKGGEEE